MAESPEEDLEIIETTDIPTDPNANANPNTTVKEQTTPVAIDESVMQPEETLGIPPQERILNTPQEEDLIAIEQEPLDASIFEQLSPNTQAQTDEFPEETQAQQVDADVAQSDAHMMMNFDDPTNITHETDTTIHNKTKSEATGFDMFSFFKVEGDSMDEDEDEDTAEAEPQSKRSQTMTGLSNLDYDELNIENLRQFNANIDKARDTDHEEEDAEEDMEEKEAQPMSNAKQINDDTHSVASQRGSVHSQQDDIDVEEAKQQIQDEEAQAIDTTQALVEEQLDAMPTGDDPFGGGGTGRDRTESTIMHDMDAGMDDDAGGGVYGVPSQNIADLLDPEEDIVQVDEEDVFAYDIDNISDDFDETMRPIGGGHVTRRSIAEMVDDALEHEINTADIVEAQASFIGASDDDELEVTDHQSWMETAKKWMLKEKQLKEEIMELKEELAAQDAKAREIEVATETRISRYEEEKNELVSGYEEQVEQLQTDHRLETDKLSADNTTMARDVQFLTNEVREQKQQMDEMEAEMAELHQNAEYRDAEWKVHQENCPLLNEEIAQALESKRRKEVDELRAGSQQMDASIGRMLTENKTQEDEIVMLREQSKTQQRQIEGRNVEIDRLRSELETIKEKYNVNKGAVDELRSRADDEQRQRVELQSEYQKLLNEYDMLMAYSNEQAQVLDMAEFVPTGIDPEKFEMVKNKRSLFVANQRGGAGGRSIVQSMGGFSEFADHMRTVSNMSQALQSGAAMFAHQDMKDDRTESEYSYATSTDLGSIASNWTRYSFQRYHTHDASREFFFLLSLCVKLSLAHKYGISPDCAPNNDNLWKQAIANNIKFHEYYDFLSNELTNLYEYKYKTQQGRIQNVVITDRTRIRNKQEKQQKLKTLEAQHNENGFLLNQYQNYTQGSDSTHNQLQTIKDRTVFNPNDDFFGGHIRITTRSNRNLKLQNHRSSRSNRSNKSGAAKRHSHKRKSQKSKRHSHRHSHRQIQKEPGNDKDHPLNNDDSLKRDSEKLLQQQNKPSSNHLTQKSLEVLDPSKNPSL
eukprot:67379_1